MTTAIDIEKQAQDWFVRTSDADAPVSTWLEFQAWLETDPAHGAAYDAVERLWVELDDAVPTPTMALVAANDEIRPADSRGRRSTRVRVWLYPAMAAAAALVLTVGLWPELTGAGRPETYRTGDEGRIVRLSDGSTVHLNRHSELSVRIEAGARTATLSDGEAAFDVAHEPARPFTIVASDHEVRVLGTAFNVLNHDGRFSVAVERGLVAVTPSRATDALRLAAGQRVDQVGAAAPVLSQVDPSRASSWRQGVLVYRDAPIAEVAEDLSRYLDKPVNVSASARALSFTGALRVGDEATMLDQLQDFASVRAERSATEVSLTSRGGD